MNLETGSKTIQLSKSLLTQFVEEKLDQFGFSPEGQIIDIDLQGVPHFVDAKITFQKSKEVSELQS